RRLTKQVFEKTDDGTLRPAKEVRWFWDGNNPLVELDTEQGKTTWLFDPETFSPLAKLAQGQVWGVLHDQLGTPTDLLAQDGSIAWHGELDAHGHLRQARDGTTQPWRWPGQYEDEETALVWNRRRYYDPSSGAYISPDPLGPLGGTQPYRYAVDFAVGSDPFGLFFRTTRRVAYWDNDFQAELNAMHRRGSKPVHPLGHPPIDRIGQNVAIVELVDGTRIPFRSGINGHSEQAMIRALTKANIQPTQVARIYSELSPCIERCMPALRAWLGDHAANVDLEYTWAHGDPRPRQERKDAKRA